VEIDGGRACLRRYDKDHLEGQAERILLAAHKLCLSPDCDAFSGILGVPNTHRFRELLFRVVDTLDHTGDLLELPFEGLLQPLKRSITRGNRHDDDGYALRRYVEQEAISRLLLDPSLFGVPAAWCRTEGVAEQLRAAASLWSQDSDDWTIGRTSLSPPCVASGARHLVATRLGRPDAVSLRQRCRCGDIEDVVAGDVVSTLAFGDSGGLGVDTAIGLQAYDNNTTMLFFSMVGMFQLPCGQPGAVEQPFSEADGDGLWRLVPSQFLVVRMRVGVRHALKMHACDSGCSIMDGIGMFHSSSNWWYLLGRKEGYPCRSG